MSVTVRMCCCHNPFHGCHHRECEGHRSEVGQGATGAFLGDGDGCCLSLCQLGAVVSLKPGVKGVKVAAVLISGWI